MRSDGDFIRADDFDTDLGRLHGLVIYRITPEFKLDGLIEVPAASWDGTHWVPEGGTEWRLREDGAVSRLPVGATLPLKEGPDDFRIFARSPDEFSYFELKARIGDLRNKGVDTVRDTVNLHTKVAIPLVIPLTILLAVALATKPGKERQSRRELRTGRRVRIRLLGASGVLRIAGQGRGHAAVACRLVAQSAVGIVEPVSLHGLGVSGEVDDQRLENCGRFRALCRPYFFRSTARGSRVT